MQAGMFSCCVTLIGLMAICPMGLIAEEDPPSAASSPQAAAVDSLFADSTDETSPGAAVAVLKDGRIVYEKGYGLADLEHKVPITASTVFQAGSVAKQFTAFAVALLAHQGRLSLDDDIRKHIPEMHDFGDTITIRHLVDHTSGLRDVQNLMVVSGWRYDDVLTSGHSLQVITRQKTLNFPPGDRWLYSNSGYDLLAEIVSRVTGQPFAFWCEEHLFGPLGMSNSRFLDDHQTIIPNRAHSYTSRQGTFQRVALNSSIVGSTNLYTTVGDLLKWARNFENGSVGGASVLGQMSHPGNLDSGVPTDYAFGQFLSEHRGLRMVWHGGGAGGYRSYLARFPEHKLAVAVMANADYFNPNHLGKQVAEIYLVDAMGPLKEDSANKRAGPKEVKVKPGILRSYVGKYALESGKLLEVTQGEEKLLLHNLSSDPIGLSAVTESSFFSPALGEMVFTFERDENGEVTQLNLHMGGKEMPAVRTSDFKLPRNRLAEYIGHYYSEELMTRYQILVRDGSLIARHSRYPDAALQPIDEDHMSCEETWIRKIRFERDKDGAISGVYVSKLGAEDIWFRRVPG